jgi:hypothetical protein
MPRQTDRKWSDAGGAASASLPATGTRPGAHAGRGSQDGLGKTERTDAWWLVPVSQAIGLVVLIGYANYAAILGAAHYEYVAAGRHYLSPFYSPYIRPAWLPGWLSPALLILIFPLGFRTTCYYYRKAYYRAFFADPVACSVGEARSKGYCGELKFPFVLQNLHRYFLYAALVFLVILWWDVIKAFTFRDVQGAAHFGVGGGSLAILASTALLTLYTFSCHSLRHLIGGKLDCFSCVAAGGPRLQAWRGVSALNGHHMGFAWWSLAGVCFADLYVRMCSMGVIHDPMLLTLRAFDMPLMPFGP